VLSHQMLLINGIDLQLTGIRIRCRSTKKKKLKSTSQSKTCFENQPFTWPLCLCMSYCSVD